MSGRGLQVALIADEPLILKALADALHEHLDEDDLNVRTFTGPGELKTAQLGDLTHAVVGLSFGWVGGPRESGLDVIDFLADAAPECQVVVVDRFDSAWCVEIATAIRQLFPSIPFFLTTDSQLVHRLVDFVKSGVARDVEEIGLLLIGINPVPMPEIVWILEGSYQRGSALRLLDALSGCDQAPTASELASTMGMSARSVRNRASELGMSLQPYLSTKSDRVGLADLWLWARVRRPLLVREFFSEPDRDWQR